MLTCDDVRNELLREQYNFVKQSRQRPFIRIWNKNWELKSVLFGEIDASFEEKLNETGTGTLTLFGKHKLQNWLISELKQEEDVHITVDTGYKRWSGKAQTITYKGDDKGFTFIVLEFLHEYEHMKKVVCYSNPLLPPEFQYPKIYMWAGPSIFGIKTMIFLNLMRRFLPLWALPEDIFDPASWLANLNPANWPIICIPGDFFGDTSAWTVMTTRFGNLHDVITPVLKDAGLQVIAQRWLPGDPQPASTHFNLTQPTLVIDVVDKSGFRGPTGTVVDGLLKTVSTILSDGVSEIQQVYGQTPSPNYQNPTFFGTVQDSPWVSWRNGMRTGLSGIQTWEMTIHKALACSVVTGGKSPGWVNNGIKLLLNGVLGYIGALIGNPGLALGIFDDQVEDVVLAFHKVTNPIRADLMGSNRYGEHWAEGANTGFSLSALQAIRNGFWDTRAYTSFKVSVINGAPYWVGRHFDLGDRVSAEIGDTGILYVDQVYVLKLTWSRTQDPQWEITIGSGQAEEPPGSILSRQLAQVRAIVQGLGVDS
jgi:hypothetical protein